MPDTNGEELKEKKEGDGVEPTSAAPAEENSDSKEKETQADPYKGIAEELETKYKKVEDDRDNYREATLTLKEENKQLKSKLNELKSKSSFDPEEVKQLVETQLKQNSEISNRNTIEELAERIATSPEHKKALLLTYENRIRPSGTSRDQIAQDLQDAERLINSDKAAKENGELRQTIYSKQTRGSSGYSSRNLEADRDANVYSDQDLTPMQKKLLDFAGLKASDIKRN